MSENNNSAEQKQGGGLFGSLSNAAGGLASGVGGVASGTVNTVGGVVGNVGRGVGKTLSDASSGLENTTKGAGGSINDMTGAKSQPQKKWGPMISTLSPAPSVVFNAVGTTMASAGSIAAQRAIDHDLCIENAKAAKAAGVKTPFALTPYAKMKRGVENAIKELDFENAIILRPGMILGRESPKNKWLEDIFDGFKKISQGFQDKWAQDQTTIGRAAVAAMKMVEEGKAPEKFWVLEQSDIVRLGRDEWKV
ncbi:NAD(P)-binding protein, partial [Aureobasidium melanogenum]